MSDDVSRIERLERRLRWTMAGLAGAFVIAALALFRTPLETRPVADDDLTIPGGASLEMVGQDLRITLPRSTSSIVLQTPFGEEIARLGHPRPRQLGE